MPQKPPLQIDTFLPYMRDVIRCEQALHELNLMWRMIESSAKMNCPEEAQAILPTMAATRQGFNRLEQELVTSLVSEKVATVLGEIGTKAQYVIDIVVRNLYERTADVGFLATDNELCAFVAGLNADQAAARLRLRAYRNKYTVYDEILLLDAAGNVLVQIDESTPLEGSTDPLIAETLASDTFVETFRASDLRPSKRQALIYSRRMLHPQTGNVVGILCLCFNFEQEMAGIFHSHRDPAARSNMLLLDAENRVIESADPLWIPLGAVVPVNRARSSQLMMFSGREYLVCTYRAEGYQGYMGPPGWQGQVMIPVDVAFTGRNSNTLATLDANTKDGLLSHAQSFSAPLYEIMTAAETIRCVVWNGQVMSAGQQGDLTKLKSVLAQISETGARSNALFARSIGDLYETVLTTSLHNSEFVSHLLVDLLDRNLYERSDDCRWWALTPELRTAFAEGAWDDAKAQKIGGILRYINSLYTVYTRLFVYDTAGRIVADAALNPADASAVGSRVDAQTLANVLALQTEQDYCVTPFAATPLYGGAPTYVYHAAIRDPQNDSSVVGGIGIVFNSGPEFAAMLQGGLGNQPGLQALFVDRQGHVIASTDPKRPVGTLLEVAQDILALPNGQSASCIVHHDGEYAIMGCTASTGYREFKVSDGYQDDVLAFVFEPLGEVRERSGASSRGEMVLQAEAVGAGGVEFATFFIDGTLFALPAEHVQEAVSAAAMTSVPVGNRRACIGMLALQPARGNPAAVWVFDLGYLVRGQPTRIDKSSQVVILRHGQQTMGLLVDGLHGVPEFRDSHIMHTPFGVEGSAALVKRFIKANGGDLLIQVIDVPACFQQV
ncbi:chemotaxis protein CheW [Rhodoferax saidenbachensis]|uniref:Chemotaxis protein CheW n=1 Tax=Rhodoferax saidenbachensis TaxID=1484693 RepID=A0A1P8KCM4_9BURK|nr:chemotaxis protein CheW [Rhodoferax saidenbachensis]APW43761.1 chemotaxis protein CheW [Rhodoferax saidenbachensis]